MSTEPVRAVIQEMLRTSQSIPVSCVERLATRLQAAPRIFAHGVGRCGLVMRMTTVRLAQLGLPVAFVGDNTTLSAQAGDLLLSGSGSGRTGAVLAIAERARENKLDIVAVTSDECSPLALAATEAIILPGVHKHVEPDPTVTVQPPGSLFEQTLFVFLEATTLALVRLLDPTFQRIRQRHANLE